MCVRYSAHQIMFSYFNKPITIFTVWNNNSLNAYGVAGIINVLIIKHITQ